MTHSMQSKSMRGIGTVILPMTCAALLWLIAPAGAIPLESWDNQIPNANLRFKVLSEFGNQAVLDKETGLVWERTPEQSTQWGQARINCVALTLGNRQGWRMPSIHELGTLIDPSRAGIPQTGLALPEGHPFINVNPTFHWTATIDAQHPNAVWLQDVSTGAVGSTTELFNGLPVWCVRGGSSQHQY
jgi:hypothetical protein